MPHLVVYHPPRPAHPAPDHRRDAAWDTLPSSDHHVKALGINPVHHRTQFQVGAVRRAGQAACVADLKLLDVHLPVMCMRPLARAALKDCQLGNTSLCRCTCTWRRFRRSWGPGCKPCLPTAHGELSSGQAAQVGKQAQLLRGCKTAASLCMLHTLLRLTFLSSREPITLLRCLCSRAETSCGTSNATTGYLHCHSRGTGIKASCQKVCRIG